MQIHQIIPKKQEKSVWLNQWWTEEIRSNGDDNFRFPFIPFKVNLISLEPDDGMLLLNFSGENDNSAQILISQEDFTVDDEGFVVIPISFVLESPLGIINLTYLLGDPIPNEGSTFPLLIKFPTQEALLSVKTQAGEEPNFLAVLSLFSSQDFVMGGQFANLFFPASERTRSSVIPIAHIRKAIFEQINGNPNDWSLAFWNHVIKPYLLDQGFSVEEIQNAFNYYQSSLANDEEMTSAVVNSFWSQTRESILQPSHFKTQVDDIFYVFTQLKTNAQGDCILQAVIRNGSAGFTNRTSVKQVLNPEIEVNDVKALLTLAPKIDHYLSSQNLLSRVIDLLTLKKHEKEQNVLEYVNAILSIMTQWIIELTVTQQTPALN